MTTTRAVAINLSNAAAQVVNAGLTLTLSSATTLENVIGGSLADTLIGNTLANSLTGNSGDDALTGGSGEDLLIGAAYTLEGDATALAKLRSEWTSGSTYANRMAHLLGTLAGGLNGTTVLTSTTVKEDAAKDTLTGGSGKDWYLRNSLGATVANRDTVTDAVGSVFTEINAWKTGSGIGERSIIDGIGMSRIRQPGYVL